MLVSTESGITSAFRCICEVTNTINDKIYFGQTTVGAAYRWYAHKADALQRNSNIELYYK